MQRPGSGVCLCAAADVVIVVIDVVFVVIDVVAIIAEAKEDGCVHAYIDVVLKLRRREKR